MSRVVEGNGTYVGGGLEAYDRVLGEARARMIKEAIEEVNGVFVAAKTELVRKEWGNGTQTAAYEDFKDETINKLVGIAQVVGKPQCERQASEAGTTKITCTGQVKVPVVDVMAVEM